MEQVLANGVIKNVKGVAIGNGCWGTAPGTNCGDVTGHPGEVYKIDAAYFEGRGLISPALKQAVSWEIAAGIQNPQSVGQKTALNQLEDEDAWKVMHQLIDKGVKTACVQLGCCQSSGI